MRCSFGTEFQTSLEKLDIDNLKGFLDYLYEKKHILLDILINDDELKRKVLNKYLYEGFLQTISLY